jgi:hypothetical protein
VAEVVRVAGAEGGCYLASAAIRSKADLAEFVLALATDLQATPEAWENSTLEGYLSALASWREDSDGYDQNQGRPVPVSPSWRDVADMLIGATMYE